MSVYIKGMEMPVDCLECRIGCIYETSLVVGRPSDCPLAEAPDGDLIGRADAMGAVQDHFNADGFKGYDDGQKMMDRINAIPSADAVSMEEHVKELNDLAVEWKAKFAKAEKITDEIYDETMAKVAKECEECKERLRNIHPSAEAVTHGRLIDADALSEKLCETTNFIKDGEVFQRMINDAPTVSAEAVQGEWGHMIADGSDGSHWYEYECSHCGEVVLRPYNFCPNCGADMRGEEE